MNSTERELLASKILEEAIENIEQLGFRLMKKRETIYDTHTPLRKEDVWVLTTERVLRGDY